MNMLQNAVRSNANQNQLPRCVTQGSGIGCPSMYADDDEAHTSAMLYFDDEEATIFGRSIGCPLMYGDDEDAYLSAMRYFGDGD